MIVRELVFPKLISRCALEKCLSHPKKYQPSCRNCSPVVLLSYDSRSTVIRRDRRKKSGRDIFNSKITVDNLLSFPQIQLGPRGCPGQRSLRAGLHVRAADGVSGLRGRQVPRGTGHLQAAHRRQHHGPIPSRLFRQGRTRGTAAAAGAGKTKKMSRPKMFENYVHFDFLKCVCD